MPRRKIYVRESHLRHFMLEESLLRHETTPQLLPSRLKLRRVRWKDSMEYFCKARFADLHFYHITNKLEPGQQLYEDDIDIWRFRHALKRFSRKYNIQVIAFAIMRNHFHLLITALEGARISLFMQALQSSVIQQYNRRHRPKGKKIRFSGRFKAVWLLEAKHLVDTVRYIHLNPHQQGVEQIPGSTPRTDIMSFYSRLSGFGFPIPGGGTFRKLLEPYARTLRSAAVEQAVLTHLKGNCATV